MTNTQFLVLGSGNILWADEGFGVRCVEAMNAAYQFGDDVMLMDGGTQEVIACASLAGNLRESMVLIGLQSEHLEDFGGSLRDSVKAQIPAALNVALVLMKRWGIPHAPHTSPIPSRCVNGDVPDVDSYEAGCPSAELACRFGDERFFSESAGH